MLNIHCHKLMLAELPQYGISKTVRKQTLLRFLKTKEYKEMFITNSEDVSIGKMANELRVAHTTITRSLNPFSDSIEGRNQELLDKLGEANTIQETIDVFELTKTQYDNTTARQATLIKWEELCFIELEQTSGKEELLELYRKMPGGNQTPDMSLVQQATIRKLAPFFMKKETGVS